MALGSTQPLKEMGPGIFPWRGGVKWRALKADNLITFMCQMWEPQTPLSSPQQRLLYLHFVTKVAYVTYLLTPWSRDPLEKLTRKLCS
jgi:hypothetical protein